MEILQMKDLYSTKVKQELKEEFSYKSIMQSPRLEKIVISSGVGDVIQNRKRLDSVQEEVSLIAGQRAVITKAKKSISNFKLREGMPIGVKVTLRDKQMYVFFIDWCMLHYQGLKILEVLNEMGLMVMEDILLGIREHIIFPEIDYDKIDKVIGLNITFNTTARTDQEAFALLEKMLLPFMKN